MILHPNPEETPLSTACVKPKAVQNVQTDSDVEPDGKKGRMSCFPFCEQVSLLLLGMSSQPGTQSHLCSCSGRLPNIPRTWWDTTLMAGWSEPKTGSPVTTNPSNRTGRVCNYSTRSEDWESRFNLISMPAFHSGKNYIVSGLWCTVWSQGRATCFASRPSMSLAWARSLRSPLPSLWSLRLVRTHTYILLINKWCEVWITGWL